MINLVYVDRLSDRYAKRIDELLTINDRDFTPPLSVRKASTQTDFSSIWYRPGAYFSTLKKQEFILALVDGKIVGFASFIRNYACEALDLHSCTYITTILVDKAHRGRHFGSRLLQVLTSQVERPIASSVWSDPVCMRLFTKQGFELARRIPNDRGEWVDTFYCVLPALKNG